jgi:hypothetical protein
VVHFSNKDVKHTFPDGKVDTFLRPETREREKERERERPLDARLLYDYNSYISNPHTGVPI